jgi:spermidine/putrescine-binding protein
MDSCKERMNIGLGVMKCNKPGPGSVLFASCFFALALVFLTSAMFGCDTDRQSQTIRVLSWAGYEESEIKEAIVKKVPGAKLEFVLFTGGEDMLTKYESDPARFDLLIIDAEYSEILQKKNLLSKIEFENHAGLKKIVGREYFDKFKKNDKGEPRPDCIENDYCLAVRWGTVGLVAKTEHGDSIKVEGYDVLNEEGRNISIFDWYLPNMGVFSLMYLDKKGKEKAPYDLTKDELDEMYTEIMKPLRPRITSFSGNLGFVIQNVYSDQTDFVPGIGEWAIGNAMLNGKKDRQWYIPEKQGGIVWIEALALPRSLDGNVDKKKTVYQVLEALISSDVQKSLAWRKAYAAQVPNREAYETMSSKEKEVLGYEDFDKFLDRLHFREVPNNPIEWQRIWDRFKSER